MSDRRFKLLRAVHPHVRPCARAPARAPALFTKAWWGVLLIQRPRLRHNNAVRGCVS